MKYIRTEMSYMHKFNWFTSKYDTIMLRMKSETTSTL